MRLRAALFGVVLATVTAAAPGALADDPPKQEALPRRTVEFKWEKPNNDKQRPASLLTLTVKYHDVLDGLADKLASGLPTVIATRAYVLREGEQKPIALAVRTCRVAYDLWDEVYRVKHTTGGSEKEIAVLNLDGVRRYCAELNGVTLADRSLLTAGQPHFVGVIVEVNPVSAAQLEAMRKWISRPAGSTGIGPGDALFGAVVGVFAKQIGTADKTLRFRTQSVTP